MFPLESSEHLFFSFLLLFVHELVCDNIAKWPHARQVYSVAHKEYKSTLVLGIKYAAFITGILYRIDRGMDLLEGAGKEGSITSSASQQARSCCGSLLLIPASLSPLPLPHHHPEWCTQGCVPPQILLFLLGTSQLMSLAVNSPSSALHWGRCPPQIKAILLAQAVTPLGIGISPGNGNPKCFGCPEGWMDSVVSWVFLWCPQKTYFHFQHYVTLHLRQSLTLMGKFGVQGAQTVWPISTENMARSSGSLIFQEHGAGRGCPKGQSRRKYNDSKKALLSFQPRIP